MPEITAPQVTAPLASLRIRRPRQGNQWRSMGWSSSGLCRRTRHYGYA